MRIADLNNMSWWVHSQIRYPINFFVGNERWYSYIFHSGLIEYMCYSYLLKQFTLLCSYIKMVVSFHSFFHSIICMKQKKPKKCVIPMNAGIQNHKNREKEKKNVINWFVAFSIGNNNHQNTFTRYRNVCSYMIFAFARNRQFNLINQYIIVFIGLVIIYIYI